MAAVFFSKNLKDTKKIAHTLVDAVSQIEHSGALVIGLVGNLGAGKTTFTQSLAQNFGIKESILSPTFVLMKIYAIRKKAASAAFRHLVHIDCYRLDSPNELDHLGFKHLLKDKDAIIVIEWADRIKKILPGDTIWVEFKHGKKQNERLINF